MVERARRGWQVQAPQGPLERGTGVRDEVLVSHPRRVRRCRAQRCGLELQGRPEHREPVWRVGPHRGPVRLRLRDSGLAPRMGDAARVADQVQHAEVESVQSAQREELGGGLAGVDDDLGA